MRPGSDPDYTARRLRPFLRLFFKTLRPPLDFRRARNPCLRLRRLRLGCQVRFGNSNTSFVKSAARNYTFFFPLSQICGIIGRVSYGISPVEFNGGDNQWPNGDQA